MIKRLFFVLFLLLSVSIFSETVGYMLITIDTNHHYDRTSSSVKPYESLVSKLDKACKENETQIGDMTVNIKNMYLKNFNKNLSCYEIMEQAYYSIPGQLRDSGDLKYAELVSALYITYKSSSSPTTSLSTYTKTSALTLDNKTDQSIINKEHINQDNIVKTKPIDVTLSGKGFAETNKIKITKPWKVKYNFEGEEFHLYLKNDTTGIYNAIIDEYKKCSGEKLITQTGTFYLSISTIGDWNIEIIEDN